MSVLRAARKLEARRRKHASLDSAGEDGGETGAGAPWGAQVDSGKAIAGTSVLAVVSPSTGRKPARAGALFRDVRDVRTDSVKRRFALAP
jgi:hypothetical protein